MVLAAWKAHCERRIFHVTYLYHCQLISQQPKRGLGGMGDGEAWPIDTLVPGLNTKYLFISSSYRSCALHLFPFHFVLTPTTRHFVPCFCGMFAPFCVFVYVQLGHCGHSLWHTYVHTYVYPIVSVCMCVLVWAWGARLSVFIVFCLGLSFVIATLCLWPPRPLGSFCPWTLFFFLWTCRRANPFVLWHLIYF